MNRAEVHARFRQIVERGLARADREDAECVARIKALPRGPTERRERSDLFTKKKPGHHRERGNTHGVD
jgi:hypothetical protein